MKILIILCVVASILILAACSRGIQQFSEPGSYIHPAIEGADIPFQELTFNVEKGDTLVANTGSFLIFPANSLLDKHGNTVSGNVTVRFRELSGPLDFFLAGVPMDYDSAGKEYVFESSAMCEIYGYQSDLPLTVNPSAKPEVSLVCNNGASAHNLYYLDTIQKRWVPKGKDEVTDLREEREEVIKSNLVSTSGFPERPLRPVKASSDGQRFTIKIEPGSLPELQAYHNLRFEVDQSEKNYNPKEAEKDWNDVKIEKSGQEGLYKISFTRPGRLLTFLARPVFEEKDYQQALELFKLKEAEYNKLSAERITKERVKKETVSDNRELAGLMEEKRERINKIIRAKNAEEVRVKDSTNANDPDNAKGRAKAPVTGAKRSSLRNNFYRTLVIDGFGFWNCDLPILPEGVPIFATFQDKAGKKLDLQNITVIAKGFDGIFRYENNNIKVIPGYDQMIWSVYDKKFVYLTYHDFRKCIIDSTSKQYTFTMNVYSEKLNGRDNIMKILGLYEEESRLLLFPNP